MHYILWETWNLDISKIFYVSKEIKTEYLLKSEVFKDINSNRSFLFFQIYAGYKVPNLIKNKAYTKDRV